MDTEAIHHELHHKAWYNCLSGKNMLAINAK